MRTRVKICGITRTQDALCAAELGADAIGLVFYENSPRCLTIEKAREIVSSLPAFVTVVGLFVDEHRDKLDSVLRRVNIDMLQFHGDEDEAYCRSFGLPFIKAIRMRDGVDLTSLASCYYTAGGLLLDSWDPGAKGGTGRSFDWRRIPHSVEKPIILAGGLNAGNVGRAIRAGNPYAVDVSSGVEYTKGVKDADKMAAFIKEVNQIEYTSQ